MGTNFLRTSTPTGKKASLKSRHQESQPCCLLDAESPNAEKHREMLVFYIFAQQTNVGRQDRTDHYFRNVQARPTSSRWGGSKGTRHTLCVKTHKAWCSSSTKPIFHKQALAQGTKRVIKQLNLLLNFSEAARSLCQPNPCSFSPATTS